MTNELYHFGVKGMHWGVRRYQNRDGSLTPEGERRILSSKKNLRRAFKKSAKAHEHDQGRSGDIYTGTSSTGKNYDRVHKSYIKAIRPMEDWLLKQYDKIDAKYGNDYDKWEKAELKLLNNPTYRSSMEKVSHQYVHALNRAKLQDIGISDLERGEKYMYEYGLAYRVENGRIRYGKNEYL